jgi:hypothetical protein
MKTFLDVMLLSCLAFAQDDAAIAKAKAACGPDDVSFSVKTSEGSHPAATVEPGEHHLCTNWQSFFAGPKKPVGLANLTAEAGRVYYFRIRVFAFNQVAIDLDPVNTDQGQYLVATSKMSESHPKKP